MTIEWAVAAAVAGMAAATYLTRASGYWLMSFVRVTQRVERLLRHLAGSVFVAIVVGGAMKGDAAASIAIVAAMATMAATRSAVPAVIAGVVAAAGWRAMGGT